MSNSTNAISDIALSKSQLDETHTVITVTLDRVIKTQAVNNCRASRFAFIDKNFVETHSQPLHKQNISRMVEVLNGREIAGADIEHPVRIPCRIDDHWKELPAFATKLGHYPLVLGIL